MDAVNSYRDEATTANNKVGFVECVVISTLWSSVLLEPWIAEWLDYALPKMFGADQMNSTVVEINLAFVMAFKCVLAILVAVSADLCDHKYFTYVVCLIVASVTPLAGIFVHNMQITGSVLALPWGISFIFIGTPVMYSVMFSQSLHPNWKRSRWLIAALFFISYANQYIEYWITPHGLLQFENVDRTIHQKLIPTTITTISLLAVLPMTIFMKKFAKPEILAERNLKQVLIGLREDVISTGRPTFMFSITRSTIRFVLFLLIFFPTLTLIGFRNAVFHIGADEDGDVNVHTTTLYWFFLWQMIALIPVELLLFVVSCLSMKVAKCLTLILPYLFTSIAAVLVYKQLSHWENQLNVLKLLPLEVDRSLTGVRVFHDHVESSGLDYSAIPEEGTRVVEFYNTIVSDASISVTSLYFRLDQLQYGQRDFAVLVSCNDTFQITVTFNASTKRAQVTREVYTESEQIYSFIITGNETYGIEEIIAVTGHNHVKPQRLPILIIMNTFVLPGETLEHQVKIKHIMTDYQEIFYASPASQSILVKSFPGMVTVTYQHITISDTPTLRHAFQLAEIETYSVYSILIKKYDKAIQIEDYLMMQMAGARSLTEELAYPNALQDNFIDAVFGALGGSLAVAQAGYIHFLWTDSPQRMRTVIIALFQVTGLIVHTCTDRVFGRLDKAGAKTMLMTQCIALLWVSASLFLYYFYFKFDDEIQHVKSAKLEGLGSESSQELQENPEQPQQITDGYNTNA